MSWHPISKEMFNALPQRARELVFFKTKTSKVAAARHDGFEVVLDVSQTLDWLPENSSGGSTCLTENALLWLLHGRRTLLGHEAFAIQGGSTHQYPHLRECSNDLLSSLAGNMFNGPTFMAVVIAALACV